MTGGSNPPRAGAKFERDTRAKLEAAGFLVTRAGGSLGQFDLIAIRKDGVCVDRAEVWLVQCKRNSRLDTDAWNNLYGLAKKHGATAVLAGLNREVRPYRLDLWSLDGPRVPFKHHRPVTRLHLDDG